MSAEIQVNEMNIPTEIEQRWQKIINTIADIFEVPTGLIMRVHPHSIEVFVASETEGNPYHVGEGDELNGLYCETVIRTQTQLMVPNALIDPIWDHNPDIKLNMISYLGFPINWPDGKNFGTICVLDKKPNHYSTKFIELLKQFKLYIEEDLVLLQKNIQLESLIQKNKEFNGILAHDLRNPLSAILFGTELVTQYKNDLYKLGLSEILDIIIDSANYMKSLIDDLLNFETIELGHLSLKIQTINYNEFIEEIYTRNQIITGMHGIILHLQISDNIPNINLDPLRINQVIDNLIMNSIRFSPKGSIIQLIVDQEEKSIRTSIIDQGSGIPDDEIEVIFNPFHQGTSHVENPEIKSTGLGLAIVKKIIDLHKGEILVQNNLDKGVNISFTIPLGS